MNTPYFRGSNEENAMATSPLAPPNTIHATPNRRVLGDVSTNPRVYSSPATGGLFSKKVMMGSPLKRSFTAAVEDGYGLKYLKRRRVSGEFGFGEVVGQRVRREDGGHGNGNGAGVGLRARSVPEGMATLPESTDEPLLYSPTEPNTPSDSGGETHDSFASLINFDPSSHHIVGNNQSRHYNQHEQQHQQLQQTPQFLRDHVQFPPPTPHFPPPQQQQQPSGLIFPTVSHAETLKLRLQVAMYKIRTNQVNVPFAELQIEGEQRNAEEEAMRSRHRVNEAVEAAVATMRREAMDSMPRSTCPPPMLIPGPLLYPTAYSSRMIQQPDPVPQHHNQQFDLGPLAAAGLFMSDQQTQGGNMMPDM